VLNEAETQRVSNTLPILYTCSLTSAAATSNSTRLFNEQQLYRENNLSRNILNLKMWHSSYIIDIITYCKLQSVVCTMPHEYVWKRLYFALYVAWATTAVFPTITEAPSLAKQIERSFSMLCVKLCFCKQPRSAVTVIYTRLANKECSRDKIRISHIISMYVDSFPPSQHAKQAERRFCCENAKQNGVLLWWSTTDFVRCSEEFCNQWH